MDDRELEALRDQVLREPEGDPVVGRRDPEDVWARLRVDDSVAAFEDDADRDARASGDPPRRVDAGSLVDDRDRVVVDRAAHVRNGAGRRESAVERLDLQVVRASPTRIPVAFTSLAASRAPFSIDRPRYGVREKGALTTT